MAKTAKRLFGPAQLTNAAATKYTVPATTKTVITHIHFSNPGAAVNITASIGADAAGTRILDAYPMAASSVYEWYSSGAVMDAAEVLQAFASTTAQVTMTVFGYELTLG